MNIPVTIQAGAIFQLLCLWGCGESYVTSEKVFKGYRGDTTIVEVIPPMKVYTGETTDTTYIVTIDSTKNGKWTIYYDKEYTMKWTESEFVNSNRVGLVTEWYENGNKKHEYLAALKGNSGYYKIWYPDGNLRGEGSNVFDAVWLPNGNLGWMQSKDENGNLLLEKGYYNNGNPMFTSFRKNIPPDSLQEKSEDDYLNLYWDSLGKQLTKEEFNHQQYGDIDSTSFVN